MDENMPKKYPRKTRKKVRGQGDHGVGDHFGNIRGYYTANVIKWIWHDMKIDKQICIFKNTCKMD